MLCDVLIESDSRSMSTLSVWTVTEDETMSKRLLPLVFAGLAGLAEAGVVVEPVPYEIENPTGLDERRINMGLPPMAEYQRMVR